MSRLRRLVLSDRFFFLTVKLLPKRRLLDESQFTALAQCLSGAHEAAVLANRLGVAAGALARHPLATLSATISAVMKSVKLSSTDVLGRFRAEAGELWQGRFPSLRSGQASVARCVR